MHKIEEIKKALNLLDTYDGQLCKTAKALGINRYTLSVNHGLILYKNHGQFCTFN